MWRTSPSARRADRPRPLERAAQLVERWSGARVGYGFAKVGTGLPLEGTPPSNAFDHLVAVRKAGGLFEGEGVTLGASFEFDPKTGEVQSDAGSFVAKSVADVPADERIASVFVRGQPVWYLNLDLLADDLGAD